MFLRLYLTDKNSSAMRLMRFLAAFFNVAAAGLIASANLYAFYGKNPYVCAFLCGASVFLCAVYCAVSLVKFFASGALIRRQEEEVKNSPSPDKCSADGEILRVKFFALSNKRPYLKILPPVICVIKSLALAAAAILPLYVFNGRITPMAVPIIIIGGAFTEICADFAVLFVYALQESALRRNDGGEMVSLYLARVNYLPYRLTKADSRTVFLKDNADRRAFKKLAFESAVWSFSPVFLTICCMIFFLEPINNGLLPIYAFFTYTFMTTAGISVYIFSNIRYYILRKGILDGNLAKLGDSEEDKIRLKLQKGYSRGRLLRVCGYCAFIVAGLTAGAIAGVFWRIPGATNSFWNNMAAMIFFFFLLFAMSAIICWSVLLAADGKRARPLEEQLDKLIKGSEENKFGKTS